jgi:hypothetical protein
MTTTPKNHRDLDAVIADTDAFLDTVDPGTLTWENPKDLRLIGTAHAALTGATVELQAAVSAARQNGRSWSEIGVVLGVSKQAAQQRFGSR